MHAIDVALQSPHLGRTRLPSPGSLRVIATRRPSRAVAVSIQRGYISHVVMTSIQRSVAASLEVVGVVVVVVGGG